MRNKKTISEIHNCKCSPLKKYIKIASWQKKCPDCHTEKQLAKLYIDFRKQHCSKFKKNKRIRKK